MAKQDDEKIKAISVDEFTRLMGQDAFKKKVEEIAKPDMMEEKLSQCYSSSNYKKFQEDVQTIAGAYIGSDNGREKVKTHAKEAIKEHLSESGWKQKQFWIPTLISGLAVLTAVIAIFK